MEILKGKTAVITGSSRGLGLGIASAFAAEGANIVLSARNQTTLERSVIQLKNLGSQAAGFVCDISNAGQVEELADFAEKQFGRIDIWVNNAGIGAPYGSTYSFPRLILKK
jgi:NAD(P)-dependent dehydrogenase (short-subunit alcohol dehydrogenase family)